MTDQRLVKREERRRAERDGDPSDPSWTEEERHNPHSSRSLRRRFGARWRARRSTISCCLSRRVSAITARTPPGPQSSVAPAACEQ